MSPTLESGQHILVSRLPYFRLDFGVLRDKIPLGKTSEKSEPLFSSISPSCGDVIALTSPLDPSRQLMKRVIGVPGDSIELVSGQVIRNGQQLDETYVVNNDKRSMKLVKVPEGSFFDKRSMKLVKVPEGSFFVLGDNRPGSTDSRDWGFVPEESIIGRAWFVYWPSDRLQFLHALW